jgi:hypothetical protein
MAKAPARGTATKGGSKGLTGASAREGRGGRAPAPPEQYNIRLSPKAVAALSAYAESGGISRTRALTDVMELHLAGTKPEWLGDRDVPSTAPGACLEDRISTHVARTIDARMADVRHDLLRDFVSAIGCAVGGSDETTPAWMAPFAGRLGDVIGEGFMNILRAEFARADSHLSLTNTNQLAAYNAAHISAIFELLFNQSVSMRAPSRAPLDIATAQKQVADAMHAALDLGLLGASEKTANPQWLVDLIERQMDARDARVASDLAKARASDREI